jgi:hypothetical protein
MRREHDAEGRTAMAGETSWDKERTQDASGVSLRLAAGVL